MKNSNPTFYANSQVSCEALGSPRPSIRWFKDGREILEPVLPPRHPSSSSSSTVELSVLGSADAGDYTCLARNAAGFGEQNFTLIVVAEDGQVLSAR